MLLTTKRKTSNRAKTNARSTRVRSKTSAHQHTRPKSPQTQAEVDAWLNANADLVMAAARANTRALTGHEEL